jgi:hypothetical protein
MKRSLRTRVGALAFVCLFLLGGAAEAWAQGRYRVRVYNPQVYRRTRQTMTDRAVMRAALKRKQQRQRARRRALRRTVN